MRAALARGVAEELDPQALFGACGAASTTSPSPTACRWSTSPRRPSGPPSAHLAPGGTLHIVDFGDMAGLPGWFRRHGAWLARFHVRHRPEVAASAPRTVGQVLGPRGNVEIKRRYALLQRLAAALTLRPAADDGHPSPCGARSGRPKRPAAVQTGGPNHAAVSHARRPRREGQARPGAGRLQRADAERRGHRRHPDRARGADAGGAGRQGCEGRSCCRISAGRRASPRAR